MPTTPHCRCLQTLLMMFFEPTLHIYYNANKPGIARPVCFIFRFLRLQQLLLLFQLWTVLRGYQSCLPLWGPYVSDSLHR